ncbi:MAG: SRPBCC family protein [Gemmatimonadetes bacterium]|nr:SRPBCC family protein [Gemmatimonadota bacterium]MYF72627.1 SRPBCC family protein [Gemmatimonadota bacterium]MYK53340.1 SRPBCC family protein [Gemmatimonadota bacterium]
MAKANVFVSSVLDASVDAVWEKIRDFNALPEWHPAIADSHIEGGESSDSVGCIRNFNLHDGGNIREQLLTLSDVTFTCTYSILESPMSVEDYVATLSLTPVTDGNRTYIQWTAEFGCPADEEEELVDFIGNGVFQGGFDSLKGILAG